MKHGGVMSRDWAKAVCGLALVSLSGCVDANQLAMKIGAPPEGAVELRAVQTRRFDTLDDKSMLAASIQTLQDLGYIVTESSTNAGVVAASKRRDAEETGQIVGQVALTVVAALFGVYHNPTWDKEQTIRVTLVVTPIENSKQVETRVSFDRTLTNNQGNQWRAELILDPTIYQEFYDKLSQGAFLEAHKI